mgnify:CR=1 FL=1
MNPWIIASRPKTLTAAISPVILGSSLAYYDGYFNIITFIVIIGAASLIQIGTNFSNDFFDYIKGADNQDRLGPDRVLQKKLLSKTQIIRAISIVFVMAIIFGCYLAYIGGWPIVLVGLLSIFFGIIYTGGPYPLAYNGLGDIFVFIFFGLVAVSGTYYLHTGCISTNAIILGISTGTMATAILVVNNLRDINNDRACGKKTLAVYLGERFTKIEYLFLITAAYIIPIYISYIMGNKSSIYIVYFTLPISIRLILEVFFQKGSNLNKTLEKTAKLLLLYTILFSFGIIVCK